VAQGGTDGIPARHNVRGDPTVAAHLAGCSVAVFDRMPAPGPAAVPEAAAVDI
jgi:hypothetical protein